MDLTPKVNPVPAVGPTRPAPVAEEHPPKPAGPSRPPQEVSTGQSTPSHGSPPGLHSTYARWSINPGTHDVRVQVFDAETGQILEDVPPETFAARIKDSASPAGAIVDNRT